MGERNILIGLFGCRTIVSDGTNEGRDTTSSPTGTIVCAYLEMRIEYNCITRYTHRSPINQRFLLLHPLSQISACLFNSKYDSTIYSGLTLIQLSTLPFRTYVEFGCFSIRPSPLFPPDQSYSCIQITGQNVPCFHDISE